jgi:hypothetical protein
MSAQHTAGPWATRDQGDWQVDAPYDLPSSSAWGVGPVDAEHPVCIVITERHYDDPEFEANAHLIAAAPDMLAVLNRIQRCPLAMAALASFPINPVRRCCDQCEPRKAS